MSRLQPSGMNASVMPVQSVYPGRFPKILPDSLPNDCNPSREPIKN